MVFIDGILMSIMKENLRMMKLKVMVYINGVMVVCIKVNGKILK